MIKILPMKISDIDDVLIIEELCFNVPWRYNDFEKEINNNNMAIYKVAFDDNKNKILGYAGMWHIVTEGHITNIAVHPDYRRNGIGTLLVQEMIKCAKEKNMLGITLEVRISNITAQKLYTKYGFRPEGFRKNYYTEPKEDAVIMWKYFSY